MIILDKYYLIEESFYSIQHDILEAFKPYDEQLISHHLFRLNRVYRKIQQLLKEKQTAQLIHLQLTIQQFLAKCYSEMAYEDEKRHNLLAAQAKWLQCTTFELTEKYSISYAKTILRCANFLLNQAPFEQIDYITSYQASQKMGDLIRAKLVLQSVTHHSEDAKLLNHWINEMILCMEQSLELNKVLLGNKQEELTISQALHELETLIGLQSVKQNIYDLHHWISFTKMRQEQGFKAEKLSLHMVFTGNPGSGKTTVARIVANILKALGILTSGHLVEVMRGDLVGEYIGHTAVKTLGKLAEAKNGVLFIDEAYALTRAKNSNDFGMEAVDTIVKAMEDDRDTLVIILAGYPKEMESFIKSNPGLASRFKYTIKFPDYTLEEQLEILELMLKQKQYRMTASAKKIAKRIISRNMIDSPSNHGNGRLVRNMLEDAILKKATYTLTTEGEHELDLLTEEVLYAVESSDRYRVRNQVDV